ncbi:MAG: hypothetical protein JWP57_2316 [Spirosoma sp.]|nr:hypothetical protein [Spirosoma sp.]
MQTTLPILNYQPYLLVHPCVISGFLIKALNGGIVGRLNKRWVRGSRQKYKWYGFFSQIVALVDMMPKLKPIHNRHVYIA